MQPLKHAHRVGFNQLVTRKSDMHDILYHIDRTLRRNPVMQLNTISGILTNLTPVRSRATRIILSCYRCSHSSWRHQVQLFEPGDSLHVQCPYIRVNLNIRLSVQIQRIGAGLLFVLSCDMTKNNALPNERFTGMTTRL